MFIRNICSISDKDVQQHLPEECGCAGAKIKSYLLLLRHNSLT